MSDRRRLAALLAAASLALLFVAADAGAGPTLTPRQAQEIRVLLDFLDAFNTHDPGRAMGKFAADASFARYVGAGDCDYRRGTYERHPGRALVLTWLRERARDHDRLVVSSIRMIGERGADVRYSRRTSDTLRELGLPGGLRTGLRSKVGFTTAGPAKITQFANSNDCEVRR